MKPLGESLKDLCTPKIHGEPVHRSLNSQLSLTPPASKPSCAVSEFGNLISHTSSYLSHAAHHFVPEKWSGRFACLSPTAFGSSTSLLASLFFFLIKIKIKVTSKV